jgi:hypothetical protein
MAAIRGLRFAAEKHSVPRRQLFHGAKFYRRVGYLFELSLSKISGPLHKVLFKGRLCCEGQNMLDLSLLCRLGTFLGRILLNHIDKVQCSV